MRFKFIGQATLGAVLLVGLVGCSGLNSVSNESGSSGSGSSSVSSATEIPFDEVLENSEVAILSTLDAAKVNALLAESSAAQASLNITEAASKMEAVLKIDPQNTSANLVLGINDLNILVTNSDVVKAVNELFSLSDSGYSFETNSMGGGDISKGLKSINSLDPAVLFLSASFNAKIQKVVTQLEPMLPRIDSAITRLQFALKDPNFTYTVPSGVFKGDSGRVIQRDQVLAAYAALNLIRAVSYQVLAYDYSFKEGRYRSASHLLSENPKFLTLKSDGQRKMKLAGISYRNVCTSILELYKFSDLHPERTEIQEYLGYVFSNGRKVAILDIEKLRRSFSGSTESLVIPFDVGGPYVTLEYNFGNFFNNPPKDFRKFLGINVVGELTASSFPSGYDFSLNGLFPNLNSFDDWQKYNYFGFRFYNPSDGMESGVHATYQTRLATDGRYLAMSVPNQKIRVYKVGFGNSLTPIGTIDQAGAVAIKGDYIVVATDASYANENTVPARYYVYRIVGSELNLISSGQFPQYFSYISKIEFTSSSLIVIAFGQALVSPITDMKNLEFSYVSSSEPVSNWAVEGDRLYATVTHGLNYWWNNAGYSKICSFDAMGNDQRLEYELPAYSYISNFEVDEVNGNLTYLLSSWSDTQVIQGGSVIGRISMYGWDFDQLSIDNGRIVFVCPDYVETWVASSSGNLRFDGRSRSVFGAESSALAYGSGAWMAMGSKIFYQSF